MPRERQTGQPDAGRVGHHRGAFKAWLPERAEKESWLRCYARSMQGVLKKMSVCLDAPVAYTLQFDAHALDLNECLGDVLTLTHTGNIYCSACGQRTPKSYSQGHCYRCMTSLARCDLCIVKPETCHYAAGTCREPAWGETHCMTGHVVYLANTSSLKVGVTRAGQVPTRWIDQGATQALPIMQAATRHVAGLLETAIASRVADKTNWRAMLRGDGQPLDLVAAKAQVLADAAPDIGQITDQFGNDALAEVAAGVVDIRYPVRAWPDKIRALSFDRETRVSGELQGIKGQYLLLDTGVINIRKFTGYEVNVTREPGRLTLF